MIAIEQDRFLNINTFQSNIYKSLSNSSPFFDTLSLTISVQNY